MEKSEGRKSDSNHVANKKSALQTVGEFLREARQSRNLSVEDLSSSLRIGKEQLIALESGDEGALPEKVFIKAMIRRISEKLSLDTSFILEELKEKENLTPKVYPQKKTYNKPIGSNNSALLLIILSSGLLGIGASIFIINQFQPNQRTLMERGQVFNKPSLTRIFSTFKGY